MSVEHRSSQIFSDNRATEDEQSADDRSADESSAAGSDVELEYHSRVEYSPDDVPRSQSSADRSQSVTAGTIEPSDAPLSHRIERTKLRTQVTALERALETSEYRQHEIVTQYERLLAERTDDPNAARGDRQEGRRGEDESDAGLLTRLLERWR